MRLDERSVVFVTLDSCRYDVAASATLPALSAVGPLVRAETHGTYTLPAHIAYFNGLLPRPVDGWYLVDGRRLAAIWRSSAARPTRVEVGVPFTGRTVMDHYAAQGFRVVGAGGVTFFDASNPVNLLPSLFPEFLYFGRPAGATGGRPAGPVDRDTTLPLSHVDELADLCLSADRFFLFVNCPSTHIPYTTPDSRLSPRLTGLLERLYRLHDRKEPAGEGLDAAAVGELLDLQRRALRWADGRLGRLFDRLRNRQPLVVVCADHGEEFGEGDRYGHAHPHETVTTVPMWTGVLR